MRKCDGISQTENLVIERPERKRGREERGKYILCKQDENE